MTSVETGLYCGRAHLDFVEKLNGGCDRKAAGKNFSSCQIIHFGYRQVLNTIQSQILVVASRNSAAVLEKSSV